MYFHSTYAGYCCAALSMFCQAHVQSKLFMSGMHVAAIPSKVLFNVVLRTLCFSKWLFACTGVFHQNQLENLYTSIPSQSSSIITAHGHVCANIVPLAELQVPVVSSATSKKVHAHSKQHTRGTHSCPSAKEIAWCLQAKLAWQRLPDVLRQRAWMQAQLIRLTWPINLFWLYCYVFDIICLVVTVRHQKLR